MTTLRVGVVNGLTDDEIIDIRRRVRPDLSDGALWTDTLAFAREVERMGTRSLRAENERLRALLREAQKWLGDNDDEESLLRRIDAALKEKP